MKLKVCGMTSIEQIEQLAAIEVDFAGLIFYEKSARFAGEKIKHQRSEIKKVAIDKVGVFVNAETKNIRELVEEYDLKFVQLHGDETPEFCNEIRQIVFVIKAIRIGAGTDLQEQLNQYEEVVDYFLFDTDSKQYGGSGQKFNWQLLQKATINKPFFLSGGIGVEDTEAIKNFQHPNLFAIDVNSKMEITPGIKDMAKVKRVKEDYVQLPRFR